MDFVLKYLLELIFFLYFIYFIINAGLIISNKRTERNVNLIIFITTDHPCGLVLGNSFPRDIFIFSKPLLTA